MKISHIKLIILSGLIWLGIGFYLLQLGLKLVLENGDQQQPLLAFLSGFFESWESAAILLIAVALLAGYLKGRYVLGKSAHRGVDRIRSLPNPAPLIKIYNRRYYLLLGAMVALGISIKYMGLSNDIRGFIDTIIGAALVNGAMIYFKLATEMKAAKES